ncbi:hypothetical protein J6590_097426 [Homalodisca vitripennis]|nr:hypothetical protein J6590_097426 [Homalodisca vitripennis]
MEENNSTKKDDDVCKGDNLTSFARKIDRFLREPNEDESDVDLSGESEVFDSDRDPEYHPTLKEVSKSEIQRSHYLAARRRFNYALGVVDIPDISSALES